MKKKTVVTVFGGSSEKIPERYKRAAYELGRRIALKGWILKNGAGKGRSCMGRTIDGALDAGGRAEGVIIKRFLPLLHPRLQSVRIYEHMRDRKRDLLKAHACVVEPGGLGTLDELSEILALKQAGLRQPPVVILNLDGFFDELLVWFDRKVVRQGFAHRDHLRLYRLARTPRQAVSVVNRLIGRIQ